MAHDYKITDPGQLEWRCRRGTLELDLLMSRFLKEAYYTAPINQQRAFQKLLDYPDDKLSDLLSGTEISLDKDVVDVVERICNPPDTSA